MLKRFLTVALFLVLTVGPPTIAPQSALAVDSDCKRVTLYGRDTVDKYIPVAGWGLTNWTVSMNVGAYDRCNHGWLGVNVGVGNDVAVRKGGNVYITSVRFRISGRDTWYSMSKIPGNYVSAPGSYSQGFTAGSHVDLSRTTRITHVRVYTAVYTRQDGSNWVGIASDNFTCNLVQRTCS